MSISLRSRRGQLRYPEDDSMPLRNTRTISAIAAVVLLVSACK